MEDRGGVLASLVVLPLQSVDVVLVLVHVLHPGTVEALALLDVLGGVVVLAGQVLADEGLGQFVDLVQLHVVVLVALLVVPHIDVAGAAHQGTILVRHSGGGGCRVGGRSNDAGCLGSLGESRGQSRGKSQSSNARFEVHIERFME